MSLLKNLIKLGKEANWTEVNQMALEDYRRKRNFNKTSEPDGKLTPEHPFLFVIQKHDARHLHYDFRLELNGVLLSWAIPKGPCFDPSVKRLAMHVEDHPVEYGFFEGIIPKGEYGGGTVMLWDMGTWKPLDDNPAQAYHKGHLRFELVAQKLKGRWDLLRFKEDTHWFLIKYADEFAQKLDDYDVTLEEPNSVSTNQSLKEIADNYQYTWSTNKGLCESNQLKKTTATKNTINLPSGLEKSEFPDFIPPQLATLVDHAPQGDDWLHELKFDGYRILAFLGQQEVILKSRNNKDWTQELMPVAHELKNLSLNQVIFDGEVVVLDKKGRSNFQLLQNTIKGETDTQFVYYLFDLLYYDQYDLRGLPLRERKRILKTILNEPNSMLRYSDHIISDGPEMYRHSCELGLEGIVSKQVDSPYISKRSPTWLKIKCLKRQEFVIGGYSVSSHDREFKSLYLGVFANEQLIYTGNVGTGFSQKTLREIYKELKKYETAECPFTTKIPGSSKVIWVKPILVAEIEFTEWTEGGHLRHPSFKGLRSDKIALEVRREKETALKEITKMEDKNSAKVTKKRKANSAFTITHPDKILYPEDGITKKDLLLYYEAISDVMLPYVINRPLSLLRCPGDYEHCFFQRHFNDTTAKALKSVAVQGKKEEEPLIYLDNKEGLLSLVQMGVLEIHPWGSLITHLDEPDFIVMDLDPAPDVSWSDVVEAAFEIKSHLSDYHLTSFVKTTGGKGLHVVIPIKAEYNWDEVKNFTYVFVQFLEQLNPHKYISKMAKAQRKGKIFIDYLRNQKGSTAVGAYSTRARLHAPVSVPIHWDELTKNQYDTDFTIKTVPQRLANLNVDPWGDFFSLEQSLNLKQLRG